MSSFKKKQSTSQKNNIGYSNNNSIGYQNNIVENNLWKNAYNLINNYNINIINYRNQHNEIKQNNEIKQDNYKMLIIGNGTPKKKNPGNDLINNYDVVMRFNLARTEGIEYMIGNKTDILTIMGLGNLENAYKKNTDTFRNAKLIWCIIPSPISPDVENKWKSIKNINFIDVNIYNIKQLYNTMASYIDRYDDRIKNMSAGLMGIYIALYHFPQYHIDVMGFDQFQSGHYFEQTNPAHMKSNHKINTEILVFNNLLQCGLINYY